MLNYFSNCLILSSEDIEDYVSNVSISFLLITLIDDPSSFRVFVCRRDNISSIFSISFLFFFEVVRPNLFLLLGNLVIGISNIIFDGLEEAILKRLVSIFVSILSNYLPMVLRH